MCVTHDCGSCWSGSSGGRSTESLSVVGVFACAGLVGASYIWAVYGEAIIAYLTRVATLFAVFSALFLAGYLIGLGLAYFDLVTRTRIAIQGAMIRRRLRNVLRTETPALGPDQPLALPAARLEVPLGVMVSDQPVPRVDRAA